MKGIYDRGIIITPTEVLLASLGVLLELFTVIKYAGGSRRIRGLQKNGCFFKFAMVNCGQKAGIQNSTQSPPHPPHQIPMLVL
jgi:hypothetical protein